MVLCRFLDAGNKEAPASKKRQGTKSREVGHRLRERFRRLFGVDLGADASLKREAVT